MALSKVTYEDGVTVITAENLNDIQDAIIALEGGGTGPSPYNSAPASLASSASAGSASEYARGDHQHAFPTASNIGAVAVTQGVGHSGEFLVVGSNGDVTTVTLSVWQGGSF